MVKKLGLEGSVVFPGFMQNMPAFLKTLDVFVMPSLLEGQPISLLEAMASGTPVLASAINGVKETVTHNVDAWLVSPGSPEDLAEALLRLLLNKDLRQKIALNAKRKVAKKFSLENFVSKHVKVYKSLTV